MSEETEKPEDQKGDIQPPGDQVNQPEDNAAPGAAEIKTSTDVAPPLQTPDAELENSKMEVHHPHHLTHKKKWNEYLLEFLMLFLAVFLGFVAENIREHYVERHRETVYMRSLLQELKFDTTNYQKVISHIKILNPALDSSYTNVKEAARFDNILQGKWQSVINQGSVEYRPSLTTIQQMQSSGNLRLIEKHELGNKISEYLAFVRGTLERGNENVAAAVLKIYDFEDSHCDYTNFRKSKSTETEQVSDSITFSEYSMALLEKDPIKLNEFANSFINFKSNNTGYNRQVVKANDLATELILLIQKEYD